MTSDQEQLRQLKAQLKALIAEERRAIRALRAPLDDRTMWVEARLVKSRRPSVTAARRKQLELAYDKMKHAESAKPKQYGQRLSEKALTLYPR